MSRAVEIQDKQLLERRIVSPPLPTLFKLIRGVAAA
jgi:hypothetical protein